MGNTIQDNWIEIRKGKTPEFGKDVLIVVDGKTMTCGYLKEIREGDGYFYTTFAYATYGYDNYDTDLVTHWQPLPEFPNSIKQ